MSLTLENEANSSDDIHLPPEVWYRICSFLPKSDLVNLRLVCSDLGIIALHECYKTIYIEVHRESSPRRLCEIVKSCKLRHQVRELVLYDNADYLGGFKNDRSRQSFLNTLPLLRFFSRLISLRVRFRAYSQLCRRNQDSYLAMQHRQDMLDTIFYWIAGMGNTDPRHMIDPDAVFHDDKIQDHSEGKSYLIDLADFSQPAIPLQQLIVTNLPDQHDDRLNTSEAFLKIMSMPSLRDIRLHVEPRINILHPVASSPFSPGKYKFFNNLHVSWLAPDIAGNLQILTLNYKEFWGWCPKMDFRRFELPQLKALSLGRYVFSHQWQIDWFASIGNGNGSGGLEELYLHDCPILYEATHIGPFDTSDPGYPLQESVLGMTGDCETHNYPIRWHDVFSQWAGSLNNLKVFHMGKSTYQNSRNKTFRRKLNVQNESQRHQIWYDLQEELASPCPSGPPTYSRLKQASSLKGQLTSIEFNQNRRFQMKYIEFDIGRMCHNPHWPWVRRGNSNECWAPEEGTVVRDAAAYEVFMDAVHSRVVV